MNRRALTSLQLTAAVLLLGCASKWESDKEQMEARVAAGPLASGDPSSCLAAGASAPPPIATTTDASASHAKCPSIMAFGMTIQPCCTPDNQCGADGTAMGFGCTALGDPMFRMIAGPNVPAPQTCDGMPP